jgi:hypothetical protein
MRVRKYRAIILVISLLRSNYKQALRVREQRNRSEAFRRRLRIRATAEYTLVLVLRLVSSLSRSTVMSGALPTPSEPADTPDGSDSVARRLSPEEGSTKGAEVKRRAHRKSRFGCKVSLSGTIGTKWTFICLTYMQEISSSRSRGISIGLSLIQ